MYVLTIIVQYLHLKVSNKLLSFILQACSELQVGVGPYKEDNAKLIKENNDLRHKLLKAKEAIEETRLG